MMKPSIHDPSVTAIVPCDISTEDVLQAHLDLQKRKGVKANELIKTWHASGNKYAAERMMHLYLDRFAASFNNEIEWFDCLFTDLEYAARKTAERGYFS